MTDITISAPYYNYEAYLPWSRYRDATLTELCQAATYQLTSDVLPPTLISRWGSPTLSLRIPGREIPSMNTRVHEVLSPGDLILLLTAGEIERLEGSIRDSLVPPLFRSEGYRPLSTSTLAFLRALGAPATGTIQRRYDHLLADQRDAHTEEMEHDEEIIDRTALAGSDQVATVLRTLDLISQAMARRRGEQMMPPVPPVEVKKVLNMDTFNRVCPLITSEQIATLTTALPETSEPVEDNDAVGGPQDAGLGACSVCLLLLVNRTKAPDELRKMPNCVHMFHSTCLAQWLTNNAITCPVCREPAVTDKKDYGYLGYGRQPDIYVPATTLDQQEEEEEEELPAWIPVFPRAGNA